MIVIAIIGILATVLYPTVTWFFERARLVPIMAFERDMRNKWETLVYYDFETIDGLWWVYNQWVHPDWNYSLTQIGWPNCWWTVIYGSGAIGLKNSWFFSSWTCLQTNDNVKLSWSDFVVMHWIKTIATSWQVYTILNAGSSDGFRFGLSAWQIWVLEWTSVAGYYEAWCWVTPKLNDNRWHHIAAEFAASQGEIRCFYDGKQVWMVSIPNSYGNFIDKKVIIGNDPYWLWGVGSYFEGELDNIYIIREDFR